MPYHIYKRTKSTKAKYAFIGIVLGLVASVKIATAEANIAGNKVVNGESVPSIAATLRSYKNGTTQFTESWVFMSPEGVRVKHGEFEVIKNFVTKQAWLIDRARNSKHEIDIKQFAKSRAGFDEIVLTPEAQSNVLGLKPCSRWKRELRGKRVWRGRVVEEWHCTEESGIWASDQYYDPDIGMVVRVERADSRIDELINITRNDINQHEYLPNEKLSAVSLVEIISSNPTLGTYSNTP